MGACVGLGVGADGLAELGELVVLLLVLLGRGKRELGTGSGAAHDTSMPTIDSSPNDFSIPYKRMLLILFEALGAGLLLVLIVWWTMFHGRPSGEREGDSQDDK